MVAALYGCAATSKEVQLQAGFEGKRVEPSIADKSPLDIEDLLIARSLAPFVPADFSPDGVLFAYTVLDPARRRAMGVAPSMRQTGVSSSMRFNWEQLIFPWRTRTSGQCRDLWMFLFDAANMG